MVGFPILADNHVRQPIIDALRTRGWDVARAIDLFGERNVDEDLMAFAAREGRVFVTSDDGIHVIAHRWLREGRPFRMIYWWAEHRRKMSDGDFVQSVEQLAAKSDAFAYAVEYIKPQQ